MTCPLKQFCEDMKKKQTVDFPPLEEPIEDETLEEKCDNIWAAMDVEAKAGVLLYSGYSIN